MPKQLIYCREAFRRERISQKQRVNTVEIKAGMVFALETYCPASDGISAARIEEEVVITNNGAQVLTKFPAQELFVANPY